MIEWIIASSALILLVLALRRAVGGRISPRLRYALWGLALLRLSLPVTLWDSGLSVLRAAEAADSYQLASTLPSRLELHDDGTVRTMVGDSQEVFRWDGMDGEVFLETFHNAYGWAVAPSVEEAQTLRDWGEKAVDTGQLKRLVDLKNALRTLWQAGVWVGGILLLAINLRFYIRLRRRRQRAGSYRGRPVYTAKGLPSPCLFGLLCPAIYLPPELEGDAREHVLAHEYAHFRQGDHAWALWRGVCLVIHWYNPLAWLAAALSRRDCELACDERAVKLLGEDRRAAYGRTLVGLVTGRAGPADLLGCATTMTGGRSAVKERIALLVKRPRTTAAMACLVGAACAVSVLCTFTGAARPEDTPAPAEPPEAPFQTPEEPEPAKTPPESSDLPSQIVTPGTPEQEQDIWLVGELPEHGIAAYYVPRTGESWLGYGDSIQKVEGELVPTTQTYLPELYFEDLDGDGDRELAVISCQSAGTGIDRWQLDVYEWDGERWAGTTHRPEGLAEDFNRERVFQFYEDGTAYVSYSGGTLLLDLSRYFPDPDQPPQTCILGDPAHLPQVRYTFQDGQLWLTLAGQILNEQTSRLSGYFFDYVCPLVYEDYSHDGSAGHLNLRSGILRSDYAIEPAPPQLSEVHQNLLAEIRSQCDSGYPNAFALHDVNGDGAEELLVRWMPDGAISSAWGTTVYDSAGRETFHGFGELTFYENGTVSVPWSHNQGPAGAIWPYRLYQYSPASGYQEIGSARAMDSSMERFPAEADLDGDGVVYFIMEDALTEENAVDNDAYQAWRNQYLSGSKVLPVQYYSLTE